MAKRFLKYTPKVRGYTAADIDVSFSDYKVMSTVNQDLERRIGSVLDFSIKRLGEEALAKGKAYGVENAPTAEQFLNASPEAINALLPKDSSTFGEAARNAMLSEISTTLAARGEAALTSIFTDSVDDFGNIILESEQDANGRMLTSSEIMRNKLNAVKDGYIDAMKPYSPEIAEKLDARLATYGNNIYNKFLDKEAAIKKQQNLVDVATYSTSYFNSFPELIKPRVFVDDKTGQMLRTTTLENYKREKEHYEDFIMKRLPILGDKAIDYLEEFDSQWQAAQNEYVEQQMGMISDSPFVEVDGNVVRVLHPTVFADAMLEGKSALELLDSMSEEEKDNYTDEELINMYSVAEILDQTEDKPAMAQDILDTYKIRTDITKYEEEEIARKSQETFDAEVINFINAPDSQAKATALNRMFALDPDEAIKYAKLSEDVLDQLGEDTDPAGFSTPGAYKKYKGQILRGEISLSKLVALSNTQNLDEGLDYLIPTDVSTLLDEYASVQKARESSAMDFKDIENILLAYVKTTGLQDGSDIGTDAIARGSDMFNNTLLDIYALSAEDLASINVDTIKELADKNNLGALQFRKEQVISDLRINLPTLNGRTYVANGVTKKVPMFHELNQYNYTQLKEAVAHFSRLFKQNEFEDDPINFPSDIRDNLEVFLSSDYEGNFAIDLNPFSTGKYDKTEIADYLKEPTVNVDQTAPMSVDPGQTISLEKEGLFTSFDGITEWWNRRREAVNKAREDREQRDQTLYGANQ